MALLLDGTTGVPVTTVTGTLPVANGGSGVTTSTGTGANVLGTSPSISGAVLTTMASSVITSGTAQASTSGTSIDFTGIPSWAKRITVMFNGVSTNGTSPLLIQIGDSGGIETTGYDSCGFVVTNAVGVGTQGSTSGYIGANGLVAGYLYSGISTICLLGTNIWSANIQLTAGASGERGLIGSGTKTLSATLDRIRITTVNGTDTFDAGSINILYE